jgi:hypothetical protein
MENYFAEGNISIYIAKLISIIYRAAYIYFISRSIFRKAYIYFISLSIYPLIIPP